MSECKHCKGTGSVTSKHGGIGLKGSVWHTYSARVSCWHCQGTGQAATPDPD
jgi:DnaJ-class molecular chaperone